MVKITIFNFTANLATTHNTKVFNKGVDNKKIFGFQSYYRLEVIFLTDFLTEKSWVFDGKWYFWRQFWRKKCQSKKALTDNFRQTDIPSKFFWRYLLTNWHFVSIILTNFLTDSFPVKLIFWPKFWPVMVSVKNCCTNGMHVVGNIFDGLLRLGPSKILTEDVYPVKNFYIPSKNSTNAIKKVILRTHMFS